MRDDRELVKALLKGNGEPASALNPPEMWSGVLPPAEARAFYATLPGYQFDLEKAKAELKQSRVGDTFEYSLNGEKMSQDEFLVLVGRAGQAFSGVTRL